MGSAPPLTPDLVSQRLAVVRQRIASAGGDPATVRVCAVTKTFGIEAVLAALGAGLTDLGENYAQELVAKAAELAASAKVSFDAASSNPEPRWHMVGRIQRNKVKLLAPHVGMWQSVDRIEVGSEIARHRPGAAVLIQVNATDEATKGGVAPSDVARLADRLGDAGLDVRGLMTIGPTDVAVDPRPVFEMVAALGTRLGLPELSMGMSHDVEKAVASGATMIRVGTALFGPRATGVTVSTEHGE